MNQVELAKRLEISPRSLRNWKKFAKEGEFPKEGRPALDESSKERVRLQVAAEWASQGRPGWRAIKAALPTLPTREIQACLRSLKAEARSNHYQNLKRHSSRVDVEKANVIWAQDTTFTDGKRGAVEVVKDRGSLALVCAEPIAGSDSQSIVNVLENAVKKQGVPLVLMTDNGSGYKSCRFKSFLRKHRIVHLKSLPRCPQHNGAAERGIRELKKVLKQTRDIDKSLSILNTYRRHGSKNYQTSEELLACGKIQLTGEQRDDFYLSYNKKLLRLKENIPSLRERKLAERKMVFDMLEERGLIKQTKGSLKL